ncbi:MAG: cyclopropane-fatty-acyl-phospholipid synthase family protein [Woeseiaceae bacterium]|nr:cyclopropane-fatty-acyl-phospholipid synthase family protein [Woeseiaceae bacterium]
MGAATSKAIQWTETGLIPDAVIRRGIRTLLQKRLRDIEADDNEAADRRQAQFIDMMNLSPIALVPELANEQHYEVPAEFFAQVLGAHGKYSCCYWPAGVDHLDAAELAALDLTCRRAHIEDGQRVLDLGCGWGSLSLYIAEHFPASSVTAVSNSQSQHDYITSVASRRGLDNLRVIVADMNDFAIDERFDRIVSIEMFEHMRNYAALYERVASWLEVGGLFFKHIFVHRSTPYEFVDNGPGDWMSRHFFSGGIMPCDDLPLFFQEHLAIRNRWRLNGSHYANTSNAWLENMDERRAEILPILRSTYGEQDVARWWMRWRMFFMACAELFDFRGGQEWYVAHYLFERRRDVGRNPR